MVRLSRMSDNEKELEILIFRHQLDILERKQKRLVRPNRAEKLILTVLIARLKQATKRPAGQLRDLIRIFSFITVGEVSAPPRLCYKTERVRFRALGSSINSPALVTSTLQSRLDR